VLGTWITIIGKDLNKFVCQECGSVLSKWVGQCDICKSWNSVIEIADRPESAGQASHVPENFFVPIGEVNESSFSRRKTHLDELNRVLGGGFVDGSVVLLGGPPGIGKSTLLLQILSDNQGTPSGIQGLKNFVYVSAEESVNQVMLRANRLNISNKKLKVAASSNIHQIIQALSEFQDGGMLIIDSIQTVSSDVIQSAPGSISQVRFCTQELANFAKKNAFTTIIVGHVTKDGSLAGPKTLEHMVDCVLHFDGESSYDYRIIRCEKNRFGPTDEIGVFTMTEHGLEEVANPSSAFLSDHSDRVSGTAVFSGIEGTRPILLEIQALVSNTSIAIPRRSPVGFDTNRLSMIVAVLSKRCRLHFSNKDVYLNIAGGLRITEPSADLAVSASIISSFMQKPLPAGSVFFGEISLSGEVRQSRLAFPRIKEAQKLGFRTVFCSHKTEDFDGAQEIGVTKIRSVHEIIDILRNEP
jgi:DNA repair protein RadA/Sms